MKYYLIDYENVNAAGLEGMDEITPDSRVVLFYTKNSSKIDLGVFNLLRSSEAELAVIEVQHGKQALDIQLASYVGFLIGTEGVDTEYYIVSKDKGYRNIQDFWSDRHIYLCTSLREDSELIDDDPVPAKKSTRSGSRSGSRGGKKSAGKSDSKDHDRSSGKTSSRGSRSSAKAGSKAEPKREETTSDASGNAAASSRQEPSSKPEPSFRNDSNGPKEEASRELDGFALAREAVASLNAAAEKSKAEAAEKAETEAAEKVKAEEKSKSDDDKSKASSHRNEVNTEIQKILSKAGIAGDVINATASFVSKNIDKEGYKQLIYRGIIKEHGQKMGLDELAQTSGGLSMVGVDYAFTVVQTCK